LQKQWIKTNVHIVLNQLPVGVGLTHLLRLLQASAIDGGAMCCFGLEEKQTVHYIGALQNWNN